MLDVTLPGIDGWEMLRRVRENHGIETLPVIMFSGKAKTPRTPRSTARARSSASRSTRSRSWSRRKPSCASASPSSARH